MTEFTCPNHHIFSATEARRDAITTHLLSDFICPQCGRLPVSTDYREYEEEDEDE